MATAVFVSDIHIASPDCPRGRLFLQFLRSLSGKSDVTHLYLLGDIFDLWVADHTFFIPEVNTLLSPITMVVPLQLLAYYIAVLRDCDVDQPRNLAKSVTVE